MKKNKKAKMTKLFDKAADIYTTNSEYHIRKARVLIHSEKDHSTYYGKILTIASPDFNKNNVHEIREIYEPTKEDNRLRFRIRNYQNVKKYKSIEKNENNSEERKIAILECNDGYYEHIYSIGDIKELRSDLVEFDTKISINNHKVKILKLILPKEESKKEDLIA